MSNLALHDAALHDAIVVVSAKEQGKLFHTKDGTLHIIEYIEKHPPEYSDNEGFFLGISTGHQFGGGAPKETPEAEYINRYIKAISEELSDVIAAYQPAHIYLFEPEHLKGLIEEHLENPTHIPVSVVAYGNFVEQDPQVIVERLHEFVDTEPAPEDPASVAGEPDAAEKRQILETAERRHGA